MIQITNIASHDIGLRLTEYFKDCDEPIYIISPFIEISALEKILQNVETSEISIVTTWKLSDIKSGISTLDLYPLCKQKGWTLYINNLIHAKIYSKSFKNCFLGSMNCTNKALFNPLGNIECVYYMNMMNVGNRIELNKIIAESILVNETIYQQYLNKIEQIETGGIPEDDFELNDLSPYYVFQLPTVKDPHELWEYIQNPKYFTDEDASYCEHDLAIYTSGTMEYASESEFINDLKDHFLSHPFIKKIDSKITYEGMRFGAYKELVRDICADVPVPFAKDLTRFIQNLYGWFTIIFPEFYYIDIPGSHSQCLHKVKSKTDETHNVVR
ncbi:hypothetical protein AR505_0888 [methanogenic archaeon ISO4-H5]|nr:hypothetical protein AR505_0888 [methanogenic archaeon ISO4-H5]